MQGEERDFGVAVELRQQREQRRPQLPGEHHGLLDVLPVARADDGRPVHATVGRADGGADGRADGRAGGRGWVFETGAEVGGNRLTKQKYFKLTLDSPLRLYQ